MNLEYLRTYLEVIRLGSFSEAAKKLSVTQPAVSFQMQRLEAELGTRLIDRRQKTIVMTDAGKRLLRFAESIEHDRSLLMHDLEQLRSEVMGSLTIAASTIPGEFLLPSIVGVFLALHPAVDATVAVSDSSSVISMIQDGQYDVGFCGIAPENAGVEQFRIADDEIVLIVFPEHPFASREKVSFIEMEGESLISREKTSGTQRSLEMLLSAAGLNLDKVTNRLVLGSTQAIISAVESKIGIAFVSNLAIERSMTLGLVRTVAIEGLKLRLTRWSFRLGGLLLRVPVSNQPLKGWPDFFNHLVIDN